MLCAVLLTILFMNGAAFGITAVVDEDAEAYEGNAYFTANDLDGNWDAAEVTQISLNGTDAKISGKGAYVNDGNVYIGNGGCYRLSGTLTDGSIIVDAYRSSKVWLLLDGVDVYCSDDAALIVDQADKVFVTLAEGARNELKGGEAYGDEALADQTNGVLFAHDDVTINGSGSLQITAAYKHGIVAKDDLVIAGGQITIDAEADGIRANDSFHFTNAELALNVKDDGIVVEKENGDIYIASGNIQINALDDAIHAAGDIKLADGSVTITAGDDGIHSDAAVSVENGSLLIRECYEGIEALVIEMYGGEVTIYPEDDGLNANGNVSGFGGGMGMDLPGNAAGGMDTDLSGNAAGGRMAGDGGAEGGMQKDAAAAMPQEKAESDAIDTHILIAGGTLSVINDSASDADGLDSNGDISITGGTIRISMVNRGSNCAIDYGSESGGVCEISGGTVIAAGSASMAEAFSTSSEQCSVLYTYSAGAEAGTMLALKDTDGNALLSWEVPCSFSSVNISCPELRQGQTYLLSIGAQEEEIIPEDVVTYGGDAQGGGFGGGMQHGGRGGHFGESDGALAGNEGKGERPEPPWGENGWPVDGSVSGNGGGSRGMPMPGGQETAGSAADETAGEESVQQKAVSLSELSPEVYAGLGASLLALFAGILFAAGYRRR